MGLRALLKGPTAVQILSWPHQGSNQRPCGPKSSCPLVGSNMYVCNGIAGEKPRFVFLFAVVRGSIRSVSDDRDLQTSVVQVAATRVFRQKRALFPGAGRPAKAGEIRTPLRCGVRPGGGSFLFTGRLHFGEAWLGCAPRYKDFRRAYELARGAGRIPCELPSD